MNSEHTQGCSGYLSDTYQKLQWKLCQGYESQILFPSCCKARPSRGGATDRNTELTEGSARSSAGSKLLLRWALYLWAGNRAHLGMLTL